MAAPLTSPLATLTVSQAKREANRTIRRSLFAADGEPLAFFCECGDPHCYRPIWLTPAEYDEACAETESHALTEGHDASDGSARPA